MAAHSKMVRLNPLINKVIIIINISLKFRKLFQFWLVCWFGLQILALNIFKLILHSRRLSWLIVYWWLSLAQSGKRTILILAFVGHKGHELGTYLINFVLRVHHEPATGVNIPKWSVTTFTLFLLFFNNLRLSLNVVLNVNIVY